MIKGFKATLFAGCITLGAFAPAFAAAPVISGLPDIQIGDDENSQSSDSNLFVFSDAFSFDAYVSDADTPDALLKWSFGEFENPGLVGPEYTVNGVGPLVYGDTAIATQQALGNPLAVDPLLNRIDASSDLATFRDILFSPPAGSAPYPDQTPAAKAAAANGKFLRFYVSDGTNVSYQDTLIRTLDDNSDFATDSDGYQELVRDTNFASGWINSGILSQGVSAAQTPGQLNITVTPTAGKYRIYGWVNQSLLPYDSVGNSKFVRGKFFISTSNAANAPLNQVPGFRLRLTNEGAVNAAIHYEYAQTGYTDPGYEPFYGPIVDNPAVELSSTYLRPSSQATTPSLYRVDFDPIDVPAATGSNIGALMESYAIPDPANGTLSLQEVVLGTYDAKGDNEGSLVFEYNRATGLAVGAGGPKSIATSGAFNHEADFQPGRRQDLFFPGSGGGFATITDQGAAGIVGDTDPVPQTVFGIGLVNVSQPSNVNKLRISPNKLYRTSYYATAPVPTGRPAGTIESQGNMRFRFQTVGGTLSYLLDMSTVAGFSLGAKGDQIAEQALPGLGSQNPATSATLDTAGEDGGWYTVLASSPLDVDGIRADTNDFGALGLQPGPGNPAVSTRDVTIGVDLIQIPATIKVSPTTTVPFGRPNRAVVRLSAIKVYEYSSIDDGGYDF